MSNGFRFCQPLAIDTTSGKAEITKEFLWNMLPVDSEAKKGMITGSQLWNWLEKELENAFAKNPSKRFGGWFVRFSGMQVNFTINNEMGKSCLLYTSKRPELLLCMDPQPNLILNA